MVIRRCEPCTRCRVAGPVPYRLNTFETRVIARYEVCGTICRRVRAYCNEVEAARGMARLQARLEQADRTDLEIDRWARRAGCKTKKAPPRRGQAAGATEAAETTQQQQGQATTGC